MTDEDFDSEFMCVMTADFFTIVPNDPERPCIGPFLSQGDSQLEDIKSYLRDAHGLPEGTYRIWPTSEADPESYYDYNKRHRQPE